MPEPLRIVTADDNYLVREGVRRLLEDSGDVLVEAAVGSAPELLDAVGRLRPEAVLTDIRMPASPGPPGERPSMEGIDAAHAIRSASGTARPGSPTCSRTASARRAACWKRCVRSASAVP